MLAGLLFGSEFALIYAGLNYTTASRMVVFIYLAPPLTALGLAIFVPGERLGRAQWFGVAIAFAGIAFAFREGFDAGERSTLVGDAFGILAAAGWAATTVLIRATRLARVSATKTLFYQLAVSAAMLPIVSLAMGEAGVDRLDPGRDRKPRVPVDHRGVRELPDLVLAADSLSCEPVVGVLVRSAAVRRCVRPLRAGRADHAGVPRVGGDGRCGDRTGQPSTAGGYIALANDASKVRAKPRPARVPVLHRRTTRTEAAGVGLSVRTSA